MKRRIASSPLARQQGMTLIELMVAMAVGLMLVAGLVLLYAHASQSASELDKSVRQIENGRYAVDLLEEELSMAGYFGEANATGGMIDMQDASLPSPASPCADAATVKARLQAMSALSPAKLPFGVQGLTPAEADALPCLANHLAGTPALIVRRLDVHPVATTAMTANTLYVQSSFSATDLNATYLASTAAADLTLKTMAGTTNTVRRYLSRVYYIASCSECGRDNIPTLKRASLEGGSVVVTPLAEGIERIGLDYGFDTDGNGTPDQWIGLSGTAGATESAAAAASPLGWANVVSVRVHVLARSTEPTQGFVDNRTYAGGLQGTATFTITPPSGDPYKRRDYTTTARLNVIAGQRE
jgi:type IV pilus assembly protein PilW